MGETIHLKYILIINLLMLLLFTGCTENPSLTAEDIKQIKELSRDYTEGWLDNDSEKVLGIYADSAVIIPSGLLPIQGKKAITEFWFPDDGSTTIIHYYDLEIIDINGNCNFAYTNEHGNLSFTYEKEDFRMDRKAESYAATIYKKNEFGEWKIISRIWSDLNN